MAFLILSFLRVAFALDAIPSSPVHAQRQQTEVLFLSFSDPDLPQVGTLIEEAETRILEGRATPVHFTLEYLSPGWMEENPSRKKIVLSFLQEKHRGNPFDLVIVVNEQLPELRDFSLEHLFPSTAFLFSAVVPPDSMKRPIPRLGKVGVIRKLNYLPTLELALKQNPGTRQVVVIAGSSDFEKLEMDVAKEQFHSYEPNIEFQYWTDLKLTELKSKVANVNPDAVVLFLDLLEDANGEHFIPSRILPSIAATASRPIYGTFTSFVGNGVVGGSVVDTRDVGRILGEKAGRILNGDKPDVVAVTNGEFQHSVFDWRELHRWGIREDQLPPGSSILNWETSPWAIYRWRILALSAAVFIETFLIFLLLHSVAKRRRIEKALRQKDQELSEAQRLAELATWQWDPTTDMFTWSDPLHNLRHFDFGAAARPLQQLARFFTPDSWERLSQRIQKSMLSGESFEIELKCLKSDGMTPWVIARAAPVRNAQGSVVQLRGTMQNISDRKRAEETRLKHAAIVESSDDAIIALNLDGTVASWNSGAQVIFGFKEPDVLGRSIGIIVPIHLRDEENTIRQRVLSGERVEHYETARINKEGKTVYVSLTVSPMRDLSGRVVGISEILRDITEHKRASEKLKKSEEMFNKAFRQGPMAITLTDATTHRYIDVNETFELFTGHRREELVGRNAMETGIWEDPNERANLTKRLLADGRLRNVKFQFRTKDGRLRVAEASAEMIEIDGKPCVLGVAIDITERDQAEEALRESEKRFRLMADSAPVLMWLSGPDKLCTDFNKEWLNFTGRSMEQELGQGWADNVHPDDRHECLSIYSQAFDARENFTMEYRLRHHDGQYRWVLDRGIPRFRENHEFAGYVGCCIDITDQKEAKVAQAELSGRLIQAQEAERSRIARDLHDDINQRLALLANGLQDLAQTSAGQHGGESKDRLRELWQLTNEVATDIQHLSHQLHPSKLHYLGLAAAARDLCQEFSKAQKIEVECVVRDIPRDLDEEVSLSLFRIVQESLRNIAKHASARHVKVQLFGRSTLMLLRVSDDGVGFDPLSKESVQGLGLVSMRERLKFVGGRLTIWSRPSLGTQVEAIIPISESHARTA